MSADTPELVDISDSGSSAGAEQGCPMLRDAKGHRVRYEDHGFACEYVEHTVETVIDLRTATVVWERGNR